MPLFELWWHEGEAPSDLNLCPMMDSLPLKDSFYFMFDVAYKVPEGDPDRDKHGLKTIHMTDKLECSL